MHTLARSFCAVVLLAASGLAHAGDVPRTAFAAAVAKGTRFADSTVISVDIPAGSEVEVVAESGDMVRVWFRTSFGWVAASMLSDQAPVAADTVELSLDGPPSFR
jgi:NAD(P)H-hydrate repair Nnr-like enzyme with NAD(P)H-hydrate epimerase domain